MAIGMVTIATDDEVQLLGTASSIDIIRRDYGITEFIVKGHTHMVRTSPRKYGIEKVIFNDPATIVIWEDGTKTVVKCQKGDTYDAEKGLALCVMKKVFGNKGGFNDILKKWVPEPKEEKSELAAAVDRLKEGLSKLAEPIVVNEKPSRGRSSKVDDGKIMALAKAGRSADWIADDMGISVATVYAHLRKMNATRKGARYHEDL